MNTTRRQTLKQLAAAGTVAALPAGIASCIAPQNDAQAIVIGAGLSGLNAAVLLQDQGLNVVVLEGSDRIGGRVYTLDNLPNQPDAGGSEFSVVSYARIVDMVNRLGLKAIPWRGAGLQLAFHVNGETVTALNWPESAANLVQGPARNAPPMFLGGMFLPHPTPLNNLDSWLQPAAAQYDVPYGQFAEQAGAGPEVMRLLAARATVDDLNDMSTLWKLRSATFNEAAGGFDQLRNLEGGMSRLTDGMAELLNRPVQMNTAVAGIRSTAGGVEVTDANGKVWRADYAISTVPLPLLRNIAIEPALPELQAAAVAEIPYDDHMEVFFDIKAPFWEEDGLPASLWTDTELGLVLHLRYPDSLGCLWLAIAGPSSAPLRNLPNDQILARVAAELAKVRPSTVGKITPMAVQNWSTNAWTKGHVAYRMPGQIETFGTVLAEPHGRLHFAGEHTAVMAAGMEGAMESGERAAVEVLMRS